MATERHIDKFWHRMIETYDDIWIYKYGAVPSPVWENVLSSLTPLEIKRGLDGLIAHIDEFERYPPRPLQFFKLAKSIAITEKTDYWEEQKKFREKSLSLQKLPDKETALRHLERLRNIIANRTKTTQG